MILLRESELTLWGEQVFSGVMVSHPTVWPLTLHCGMSLVSQGSRLDWAVSSVSHASLERLLFCWTSNPNHLKPKHTKPQTYVLNAWLFLSGTRQITLSRLHWPTELLDNRQCGLSWQRKVFLLKVCVMFLQSSYLRLGCVRCHVWVSKVEEMCTYAIFVPSLPHLWLPEANIAAFRCNILKPWGIWQKTKCSSHWGCTCVLQEPTFWLIIIAIQSTRLRLADRLSLKIKVIIPDKPGKFDSHIIHLGYLFLTNDSVVTHYSPSEHFSG